jgi:hypothetical protein
MSASAMVVGIGDQLYNDQFNCREVVLADGGQYPPYPSGAP